MEKISELYRLYFAKLSGLLMYHLGCTIEDAEDTVQTAFIVAIEKWPSGSPADELAWLYKVCRNIGLSKKRNHKIVDGLVSITDQEEGPATVDVRETEDAQLAMLFSFTSDQFSPRNQLLLTLRFVCGFSISQIAAAFGMKATAVTKTIQRCRAALPKKIYTNQTIFRPTARELDIVTRTIYLLFNEGYKSSQGKEMVRQQFCEDALYFTKLLLARAACRTNDLEALYALMLFHIARFESRFGPNDEVIDLEHQDRSSWNQELIQIGSIYLEKSSRSGNVTTYHLEAAIAWLHVSAGSFASTPWQQVIDLQQQLYRQQPSPFILLNLAVTFFHAGKTKEAGAIFSDLAKHPYIGNYYLFLAAYGKYLLYCGDHSAANAHFRLATAKTNSEGEKRYIARLIIA